MFYVGTFLATGFNIFIFVLEYLKCVQSSAALTAPVYWEVGKYTFVSPNSNPKIMIIWVSDDQPLPSLRGVGVFCIFRNKAVAGECQQLAAANSPLSG